VHVAGEKLNTLRSFSWASNDEQSVYVTGYFEGKNGLDSLLMRGSNPNGFLAKLVVVKISPRDDTTVCAGKIFSLPYRVPNTHYAYQWFPAAGISDPTSLNPTFQLDNESDYPQDRQFILRVTTLECPTIPVSTFDTLRISIRPNPPGLQILTGSTTVCPYVGGIKYWVKSKEGYSYKWKVDGGNLAGKPEGDTVVVNWAGPNNQALGTVIRTNNTGCEDSIQLPIEVDQVLKPAKLAGSDSLCVGEAINQWYTTSLINAYSSYHWYTDDNTAIASPNDSSAIQISWTTPGIKKLWVKEKSNTPCVGYSDTLQVHIYPLPSANVSIIGRTQVGEFSSGVPYRISHNETAHFKWSLPEGGGVISSEEGNSIRIDWFEKGIYLLTVQETSLKGCPGIAVDTLISVGNFFIPNIITPNDDLLNEAFVIEQIEYYPQHRLTIY
jgi:hypothetical protein